MCWDRSEKQKRALFREIALDDNIENEDEIPDDDIFVQDTARSEGGVSPKKSLRRPKRSDALALPTTRPRNLRPAVSFDGSSSKGVASTKDLSAFTGRPPMALSNLDSKSSKSSSSVSHQKKAMPPAGKKRKRDQPLQMQPESRQVLKGLHFLFVRERDLGPRGVQMRKAQEWGAIRHESWTDEVTHVIADQELSHQQVVNYMKEKVVDPVPEDVPIVQYDDFVVDCIRRGYQVNAHLPHYRLPGYKEYAAAITKPPEKLGTTENAKFEAQTEDIMEDPTMAHIRERADIGAVEDHASESLAVSSIPMSERTFNDDLEEVIEQARATKDLPLDLDDEDESGDPSPEDSGNESEEEPRPSSRSKSVSFQKSAKSNFACMSKSDGSTKTENPNAHTIFVLQQMADVYNRLNDTWRTLAYRKAITQLKKHPNRITTKEQAQQLPFVGERLALKIQEIASTNRLRRLENAMLEPEEKALQTFLGIYNVGAAQAHKWIEQGHRTLSDLTEHKVSLTHNQKIGLEHYEDFASRIPRSEMNAHDLFVRRFVSKLDKKLEFTIGGSYRRGENSSGDIDFIVTKPGADAGTVATIMLDRVIPLLFKADYLQVGLSTASHHSSGDSGSKWHGACAMPLPKSKSTSESASESLAEADRKGKEEHRPWRRIDFLFTPHDCIGAALLYFTGNDIFNRSMRLLASKKSMRLNQRGLYKDVIRGPGRVRQTDGTLVEAFDERKIFEALGVPWREPGERRC